MKFIVPTLAIINYWNNALAFDIKSDKNLIAYWGQNSYGSSNEAEASKMEKPLREYCNDDTYDMFVVSFLTKFNAESPSLYPELNLGKHCHQTFPGTNLANCPEVGQDIKYCQSKGKAVVLSMGGYSGDYTIKQEKHAHHLANKMWDLFLGGKSKFRPFGDVILDGIDLDIEKGPPENYATFTHALRNLTLKDNHRNYYITAAPQCPYPDASLKAVLERGWLDAAFVQFYNNPCGLGSDSFNFDQWDNWAKTGSVNKDVKIYLGAPASPSASNTGYLPIKKLASLIAKTRSKHSSFGGVMIWDVSQGQANFCSEIKASYSEGLFRALNGAPSSEKPQEEQESKPESKPEEKPEQKPEQMPENSPTEIKPQATPTSNSAENTPPKPEQASPAPETVQASPSPSVAPNPSPSVAESPANPTVVPQASSAEPAKPSKNDGMYTPENKPTNPAAEVSAPSPSEVASESPKKPSQSIDIEDTEETEEESEEESYPEPNESPLSNPTATKNDLSGSEQISEDQIAASMLEAYLAPILSNYNNQHDSSSSQSPHAILPEEIQPSQAVRATMVMENREILPTPDINFMEVAQAPQPVQPAPAAPTAPAAANTPIQPAPAPPAPPQSIQPAPSPAPSPSAAAPLEPAQVQSQTPPQPIQSAPPPAPSPSAAAPPEPQAPPQQIQPASNSVPNPQKPSPSAAPQHVNEPHHHIGQSVQHQSEHSNHSASNPVEPQHNAAENHPEHSASLNPRPAEQKPIPSQPSNPNSVPNPQKPSPSAAAQQHGTEPQHQAHSEHQQSKPAWVNEEAKNHPGKQNAYSVETASKPKPQESKTESKPQQQKPVAASKPTPEKSKQNVVGFEVDIEAEEEGSEDRK